MARLAVAVAVALVAATAAEHARPDGECPPDGEETSALLQHTASPAARAARWCLSDMTPCNNETSCCGQCVEGQFGGMDTGICANNGTFNYSSPECIPADAPCSQDMDCCGVCVVEGSNASAPRRGSGTCKVQDPNLQCLPAGQGGCSDQGSGTPCCNGKCLYRGADTTTCCDNPKTVSGGAYTVCCDDPSENSQWC